MVLILIPVGIRLSRLRARRSSSRSNAVPSWVSYSRLIPTKSARMLARSGMFSSSLWIKTWICVDGAFCLFPLSFDASFLRCRFLYDGDRIQDDDTPASLDMEDNGERRSIYVMFVMIFWLDFARHHWCDGWTWVVLYFFTICFKQLIVLQRLEGQHNFRNKDSTLTLFDCYFVVLFPIPHLYRCLLYIFCFLDMYDVLVLEKRITNHNFWLPCNSDFLLILDISCEVWLQLSIAYLKPVCFGCLLWPTVRSWILILMIAVEHSMSFGIQSQYQNYKIEMWVSCIPTPFSTCDQTE